MTTPDRDQGSRSVASVMAEALTARAVLEQGNQEFEEFVPTAMTSQIPLEFFGAVIHRLRYLRGPNGETDWQKISQSLVGRKFASQEEAGYAAIWGSAVAATKIWQDSAGRLAKAEADQRGFEKTVEESINELASIFSCERAQLEEKFAIGREELFHRIAAEKEDLARIRQELEEGKRLVQNQKQIALVNFGWSKSIEQEAGEAAKRFDKVRLFLEEHFQNPRNRAKIVLLGS